MNATEEREQLLRMRFPRETEQVFGPPRYRANSIIVQVVFFILAAIGVGALYLFIGAIGIESEGVITGVAAIALAEYLMLARRWFGTGVEAALWICGLFALISELPSSGAPEAMLILGGACAVAGLRVRNPIFGAAAAIFVVEYLEKTRNLGVIAALVIATIAGLALLREWRRPSTEWLFIAMVLILPIYGRVDANEEWRTTTILLYASFAVVMLTLAFARRHHALLLAGMIGIGIAGVDFGERIALAVEVKLAIAGAVLLGGTFAISRLLRGRTIGVVSTPANLTSFDDLIESAAVIGASNALRPSEAPAPEARPAGDGGFGGAGASGSY
jgi:hypothetical protein